VAFFSGLSMRIKNIGATLRALLDDCASSDEPAACLRAFIEKLGADPSWPPADIQEVEAKARRILSTRLSGPPVAPWIRSGAAAKRTGQKERPDRH
jgi:hypothetical protein